MNVRARLEKRFLSSCLSAAVAASALLPSMGPALTAKASATSPTSWSDIQDTYSDGETIDLRGISLPDAGEKIIAFTGGNETLIGSSSVTYQALSLVISGGAQLTIINVSIDDTAWGDTSPVVVDDSNKANTLLIGGVNKMVGSNDTAGVYLPDSMALTIDKATAADSDADDVLDAEAGVNGTTCSSAGIGGNYEEGGGTLVIDGGTVNANTGNEENLYKDNGAGIGGGEQGGGGSVTVNGGIANAASYYGAGIGGGRGGSGGKAVLDGTGTSVTATSTGGGYDIGSGNRGSSGGILTVGSASLTTAPLPSVTLGYGGTNAAATFRNCTVGGGGANSLAGTYNANGVLFLQLSTPGSPAWDSTIKGKATWGAVANAGSYTVQLCKGGSPYGGTVTGVTADSYDFTSAIAAAGTGSYTFTVTAIGDGNTYSDSEPATAAAAYSYDSSVTQLGTPGGLAWSSTTPGKATWGAVANAGSYTVQLCKGGSPYGSAVTGVTADSYDFTSAVAAAGTGSYTFTVTAIGDGSTYTNSDTATVGTAYSYTVPTTPLSTPGGLAWDSTTPGKATWSPVANAKNYTVQLLKSGSPCGGAVTRVTANAYDFTSAIVAAGAGSYTFTVTAIGDGSAYTDSEPATVGAAYSYTPVGWAAVASSYSGGETIDLRSISSPDAGKKTIAFTGGSETLKSGSIVKTNFQRRDNEP